MKWVERSYSQWNEIDSLVSNQWEHLNRNDLLCWIILSKIEARENEYLNKFNRIFMKQMSGMVKNDKTKFFLAFPFKQLKYHKQRKQESQNKNIKSNSNRTFPTAEKKKCNQEKNCIIQWGNNWNGTNCNCCSHLISHLHFAFLIKCLKKYYHWLIEL